MLFFPLFDGTYITTNILKSQNRLQRNSNLEFLKNKPENEVEKLLKDAILAYTAGSSMNKIEDANCL